MKFKIPFFIILFFLLVILTGLFFSCRPEKTLSRLIKKFPHLIHRLDTTIIDTTIVPAYYIDTLVNFKRYDTILINKYGVETKIFRHYNTDSIYIQQSRKQDTVIKSIQLPGKVVYIENKKRAPAEIFIYLIALLALIGFVKYLFFRK